MSTLDDGVLPMALEGVAFERNGMRLLDAVSLVLPARRRTLVMGPNGAGKSLLMRVCHGLLVPTGGTLRWGNGHRPSSREIRRRQAMVFQRPVLLRRSVLGNVTYALSLRATPPRERREHAMAALELFGLEHCARRSARALSGGEQQRLALARAWVLRPEILFLDEPTASLDPASAAAVEDAVVRFHERGTSVVMATHDLAQARRLAEDVLFVCGGRVLEHVPAATFFAEPRTPQAQGFIRGELVH